MGDELRPVYDLLRRVPPAAIEEHLISVIDMRPDLEDTLFSTVDLPLKIGTDETSGEQFIQCDYNHDLESWRSPISNAYFPELPDGQLPPARLRNIEVKANFAFSKYLKQYFNGGVSSVYCWPIDDQTFGFGVFIQHSIDQKLESGNRIVGTIDCIDIVEIKEARPKATYTLNSSVTLRAEFHCGFERPIVLSGNTSDRKEKALPWKADDDHIINCGTFIEENTTRFRDYLKDMLIERIQNSVSRLLQPEKLVGQGPNIAMEAAMKRRAQN
jgi:capping protein beta